MPLTAATAHAVDLLRRRMAGTSGYYLYRGGPFLRHIGLHKPSAGYERFLTALCYLNHALTVNRSKAMPYALTAHQAWRAVRLDETINAVWRKIWERINE